MREKIAWNDYLLAIAAFSSNDCERNYNCFGHEECRVVFFLHNRHIVTRTAKKVIKWKKGREKRINAW